MICLYQVMQEDQEQEEGRKKEGEEKRAIVAIQLMLLVLGQ